MSDVFQSHGGDQAVLREKKIVVQDSDGTELVSIGRLSDGTHGIEILSPNGQTLFKVTSEQGQIAPPVTPWIAQTGVVSGLSSGFRPGTSSATFTALAGVYLWAVGANVDYRFTPCANGGNISWQMTCTEWDPAADAALGTELVVVGPNTETTNTARNGTFVIPAACLEADTGDDPAGRFFKILVYARVNSGAITADVQMSYFRNYGS